MARNWPLRPRCLLAVNPSTLSWVVLGMAVAILGLFWRYWMGKDGDLGGDAGKKF